MPSNFPPPPHGADADGQREQATISALFDNLHAFNKHVTASGMPWLAVTSVTVRGETYPDSECVQAPGGGCTSCDALMPSENDEDTAVDTFAGLSEEARESVDCPDCQGEILANALGEDAPPACICPPEHDADCNPLCEAPGCNS